MVTQLPKELEQRLGKIAVETLEEGFFVTLHEGDKAEVDPWTPGNEVTIKLDFQGGKVAGWVSVDTTVALLSRLWNIMMEDEGELPLEDAQDFAGEIVNQLVGRLKTNLIALDETLSINLSTPDILQSEDRSGVPTVLIPLTDDSGELHVIYCFKLLDWPVSADGEVTPSVDGPAPTLSKS